MTDDVLEWVVEGGGGQTPNNAISRPGEVYRFGWSRYRDQLTLTSVEGAISPNNFYVEPWRLLDSEPSVEALSSQCPPPEEALG